MTSNERTSEKKELARALKNENSLKMALLKIHNNYNNRSTDRKREKKNRNEQQIKFISNIFEGRIEHSIFHLAYANTQNYHHHHHKQFHRQTERERDSADAS